MIIYKIIKCVTCGELIEALFDGEKYRGICSNCQDYAEEEAKGDEKELI